jgi:EAL domain-containing protein (putative c-di-GMP-specific phosphodiesterase class I)
VISTQDLQTQLDAAQSLRLRQPQEALSRAEMLLALCADPAHRPQACALLQLRALSLLELGRPLDAVVPADQAVRVAEATGQAPLLCQALQQLAWTWFDLNAGDTALQCLERAMALGTEGLSESDVQSLRYVTACVVRKLGRLQEAQQSLQDLLPLTSGAPRFRCLGALASTALHRGRPREAMVWLQQAHAVASSPAHQAWLASLLTRVHRGCGDLAAALAVEAEHAATLTEFPLRQATVLHQIAGLYVDHSQWAQAMSVCLRIDALNALDDEARLDYLYLRATLARAMHRMDEALVYDEHARLLAARRERLQDVYRIKAAQLALNHLDTRLMLARSRDEVLSLRRAVAAQEETLRRLSPGTPLVESLLNELLALCRGRARQPDGRPDWSALGFHLVYQPFVNMASGQVLGFEALLRLNHPQLGPMMPGDFITRLERTGDILDIGRWVMTRACEELVRWRQPGGPTLSMAVNVATAQLQEPEFASFVAGLLKQVDMAPEQLELEITESMAVSDSAPLLASLQALKTHGVRLSIDDFGTGFCNFARLIEMDPHKIKVDRSLVSKLGGNARERSLVHALIHSSQEQGMTVTAEGIETAAQRASLQEMHCDFGQGFYFGQPLPMNRAVADLRPAAGSWG